MRTLILMFVLAGAALPNAATAQPAENWTDLRCAALFGLFAEGQEKNQPGSKAGADLRSAAAKLKAKAGVANADAAIAAERADLIKSFEQKDEAEAETIMVDCLSRIGVKG